MKKIVLRYGLYGIGLMTVTGITAFLIFKDNPNWELQEVFGYATIILSLLFVYFGIRRWRDKYNNGQLTFGRGLAIGTLITLLPSVAFGFFSWLHIKLDPQFLSRYYTHMVEKVKKETPPEKLQAALKKVQGEYDMFSDPFMQFFVMALTVLMIGFIVTVISSLILKRTSTAKT